MKWEAVLTGLLVLNAVLSIVVIITNERRIKAIRGLIKANEQSIASNQRLMALLAEIKAHGGGIIGDRPSTPILWDA